MQQRIVELLDKVANEEVTSKINKERFFYFLLIKILRCRTISIVFTKKELDNTLFNMIRISSR